MRKQRWLNLAILGLVWLATFDLSMSEYDNETEYEYPPYDGWYNNYANPSWGAAETQLFRQIPPAYSDGVYEPAGVRRPNPFNISEAVMSGESGLPSQVGRTALLVFFGQQVVEEIMDAQRPGCPPEYMNIKIPEGHSQYTEADQMPFLRSRYDMRTGFSPNNPRQQLNEITAFIDGTLMYGPNKAWTDALRKFEGGLLLASNDTDDNPYKDKNYPALNDIRLPMANPPPPRDHYLKPIKRFFRIGNPRGNENPFLLTWGIFWFRYHNFKAREIQSVNPDWSDERIFNEARKWVIAIYQKIVVYDWLEAWLGVPIDPYKKYNPAINPGISHEFQSAAMRFGHTLVPPGVYRRTGVSAGCEFRTTSDVTGFSGHKAVRTCNSYWNPQEAITEYDIDELIMGMASQICEREDNIITPDLRGDLFGPLEFSRRDLMALNIQRGRDNGVPDYNTVRKAMGLEPKKTFEDVNPTIFTTNPNLLKRFTEVYENRLEDIDVWTGGLLESSGSGPGELFTLITKDQFERIRDGDRFWYENTNNGLFTEDEIKTISQTTLKDIIVQVTEITDEDIQDNVFLWDESDTSLPNYTRDGVAHICRQPAQLNASDSSQLSSCTEWKTFDYFTGSYVSYILSFLSLGVFTLLCIGLLVLLAKRHDRMVQKNKAENKPTVANNVTAASEWVGPNEGVRNVLVKLEERTHHILVMSQHQKPIRTIDLNVPIRRCFKVEIIMAGDRKMRTMAIRIQNEYDLVLRFESITNRNQFLKTLLNFFTEVNVTHSKDPSIMSENLIFKTATTKADRQKLLEKFFRVTFSHAFNYKTSREDLKRDQHREILHCELTKHEFADALSLKPNSLFVQNMFKLVDKDTDGYVSFREFLDVIVLFAKGDAEEKARLLFDMYDIDETGKLSREDFKEMLRSLLELASESIEDSKIDEVVSSMFSDAGLSRKESLEFSDFKMLLHDYKDALNYASLNLEGTGVETAQATRARENAPSRARRTVHNAYRSDDDDRRGKIGNRLSIHPGKEVETRERMLPDTQTGQKVNSVFTYLENNRLQLFWATLYTLVTLGVFIERAYYYSVEREHAGLRRIAGYGVTVTRGAASGMMFTYSCLLVTMCRNLITYLRETFLNRYIPFDSYINFHKYIAILAAIFTVMHIIGHTINFYHISTQTASDLACLFRNFFYATDVLPKFHDWCWRTITGFTGVLLTLVAVAMYVFATPYSRRHAFRAFWFTHHMWVLLFILMILHGAGRLVQPPFMHYFCLGPLILFTFDKLLSVSRKKVEITVVRAELLPSDVTYLEFKRPSNFDYKSGQWVRIASLAHSPSEYHPFTLTSAPHEDTLSLHIRAVGPWTMNLRRIYDPSAIRDQILPKIFLDGPYGEGHQDWYKYEVAILVGGGIGVTPFASILKNLANTSKHNSKITCKKVYFLWVTRTQRQFEWMTDLIRQVEEADSRDLVSVHIFITQFKEKFDIRTTMLYICERHFQKISNRSLFTGLRSVTHFGRPDFTSFFRLLLTEHPETNVFGVFSCGPPPMTNTVEKACSEVNNNTTNALFAHHFENF